MPNHGQRQRHGVRKNLVEGIGGFVTGAALVMFLRALATGRTPRSRVASATAASARHPTEGSTESASLHQHKTP
ncbi:hypothetical protein CKO25_15385 [Thiocapsa imhoffii]|uniref:Uncharacterized protein n=2 Tax=Thiocapsa imhoffii TaxID=382777 RepID=A0A9X0WJR9_9GAMM|nr:hypothetical protein [Thiocapsa imhoffii]